MYTILLQLLYSLGNVNTIIKFSVNGNWGRWGEWSSCSETCGEGSKNRTRVCDNPAPTNGGSDCNGSRIQVETCKIRDCIGNNLLPLIIYCLLMPRRNIAVTKLDIFHSYNSGVSDEV